MHEATPTAIRMSRIDGLHVHAARELLKGEIHVITRTY